MAFKFPNIKPSPGLEEFFNGKRASDPTCATPGGQRLPVVCRQNLYGVAGEEYTLELDSVRAETVNSRFSRRFLKKCTKETVAAEISAATDYKELEKICYKYSLCDYCDLSEINIYGSKILLKVILETLYRYPRLRSKMCFVGTHSGYKRSMQRMIDGDREVLKRFNLHHILTDEDMRAIARISLNHINSMGSEELYIATAIQAFGFFDALLLDENDFDQKAFIRVSSQLRESEKMGFHPVCCGTTTATVYHEVGHLLDYLLGIAGSNDFLSKYRSLKTDMIERDLSKYATSSPNEFIAEAFSEYMCNPLPRPLAQWVGELIDDQYAMHR